MAPRLLGEGMLAIAEIGTEARLRPVSEAGVVQLITSIEALGQLCHPIQVRAIAGQRGAPARLVLMAGAHRLEAARRLGWAAIPARRWRCNDAEARLIEIDDNLAAADLSALDRSLFMAARRQAHLELHPETGSGARGWKSRRNSKYDIVSFCVATAERHGKSVRWAERYCAIGEALGAEDVAAARAAGLAGRMTELMALARLDPETRRAALALMAAGRARTVLAAGRLLAGRATPSAREANWQRMWAAWARLDRRQKAAFLAEAGGNAGGHAANGQAANRHDPAGIAEPGR